MTPVGVVMKFNQVILYVGKGTMKSDCKQIESRSMGKGMDLDQPKARRRLIDILTSVSISSVTNRLSFVSDNQRQGRTFTSIWARFSNKKCFEHYFSIKMLESLAALKFLLYYLYYD